MNITRHHITKNLFLLYIPLVLRLTIGSHYDAVQARNSILEDHPNQLQLVSSTTLNNDTVLELYKNWQAPYASECIGKHIFILVFQSKYTRHS